MPVVEAAVVAAEAAELVYKAYQARADRLGNIGAREKEAVIAEGELAHTQLENKRLQATLQEYKARLEELQKETNREWLGHSLNTAEGTSEIFRKLQEKVEMPEFLEKLEQKPESAQAGGISQALELSTQDGLMVNVDVNDPSWWLWVTEKDMYGVDEQVVEHSLDGEGYVVIEQSDVLDGIAAFVAAYLSSLPQTKDMPPKELQKVLSQAFVEVRKKGKARKLWDWGRFFYNSACWGTTLLGVYKNPMVVRATLVAVWTSSRVILGLLR